MNQAVYGLFEIPGTTMFSVSQHSHDLKQFFYSIRISCKFRFWVGHRRTVLLFNTAIDSTWAVEETYPLHRQISIDSLAQAPQRCLWPA